MLSYVLYYEAQSLIFMAGLRIKLNDFVNWVVAYTV